MIGETLATYRLVEKLGAGGMGEVYRAVDEMLDREVALKMLRPELAHQPTTVERFRAEAIALARLDHPGIARIYGFSRQDDRWFIVMEFVRGETLLARLRRARRLPWTEAVAVLGQLLDALDYAHRQGVIHRDMKPANVLVRADGPVKVTDFGIARVLGTSRATRVGHIVGTLDYMSPEQVRGEEVDGRADLYAVGILLYQLLTGQVPFRATTDYGVMMQHLQAPPPSARLLAPDVPPWFDEILQRALAKAPDDRFASAADFRSAVEDHVEFERGLLIEPTRLVVGASPDATTALADGATRAAEAPARTTRQGGRQTAPPMETPPSRAASGSRPNWEAPAASMPARGRAPSASGAPQPPRASALAWRRFVTAGALTAATLAVAIGVGRYVSGGGIDVASASATPPAAGGAPTAEAASSAAPNAATAVGKKSVAVEGSSAVRPRASDVGAPPPPPAASAASSRFAATPPRVAAGVGSVANPLPAPGADPAPPAVVDATPPAEIKPAAPTVPVHRAVLANVEFEEVEHVTIEGEKQRAREVVLRFEADGLVLTDADTERPVLTVPYGSITEATYARSRGPVFKAGRNSDALVRGLARSVSFFKSTRHWLTLEGAGPDVVLKLPGEVDRVLSALEARTSVHVERVSEK
jgi:eukaryotic-like serine/threonine-protein kinase